MKNLSILKIGESEFLPQDSSFVDNRDSKCCPFPKPKEDLQYLSGEFNFFYHFHFRLKNVKIFKFKPSVVLWINKSKSMFLEKINKTRYKQPRS